MRRVTLGDLQAALPGLQGTARVPGCRARVDVWRDAEGIPHIRAASVHDAFFAQGFVHAQDRLWHMEYDRRRACGRWAELAGPPTLASDIQMRRFRLGASARADYAAVNAETRAMLDAYAAGVNAFILTTTAWPIEVRVLESRPEPWAPWDSLAVFKVRHVEMGGWQAKAWRAKLLRQLGPERTAQLCPGTQPTPVLIVPPGMEYAGPTEDARETLAGAQATLAELSSWESGSNNWAVAGSRSASGKPLVAGDPHRALDVPNVYYQNYLACPEFDVIGLSFPGVPALPHFGHNAAVAWCVTHTMADYQDLADASLKEALDQLLAWNGEMHRESVAATIYAVFRERLLRDLMTPILGPLASEAFAGTPRGAVAHMGRLKALLADMIRSDDRRLLPPGADWPGALTAALTGALSELRQNLGPDPTTWSWGWIHATQPQHPLAVAFPELARLLNPPSIPVGGDGDTVQSAGFLAANGYGLTLTSVARYVFDLGDWNQSVWVVPLGASGHPGSPHYADQATAWSDDRLLSMRYDWERIGVECEMYQALEPA